MKPINSKYQHRHKHVIFRLSKKERAELKPKVAKLQEIVKIFWYVYHLEVKNHRVFNGNRPKSLPDAQLMYDKYVGKLYRLNSRLWELKYPVT